MQSKTIIIMGGGPAGLAAAHEVTRSGHKTILFEKASQVGGMSKTVKYKDYRFDMGGHRFFSKSAEVNRLWTETLGEDFLIRNRKSRIYYNNRYFDYPIKTGNALMGLGLWTSIRVLLSYFRARLFPFKIEESFEHWVTNRFGGKLYSIFFKTYTEKLWGIPCTEIKAEWAAQRIKGLSLLTAIINALSIRKKQDVKTLIDHYKYPKYGPGMMYERMADTITQRGGKIYLDSSVEQILHADNRIKSVKVIRSHKGTREEFNQSGDHFISSIPITELVLKMNPGAPDHVISSAKQLKYRSFITVNLILAKPLNFPDTWIYVHSPEVKLARIQNYGNWSPYMVPDKNKTALGVEYFCTENDSMWNMSEKKLIELALKELEILNLCNKSDYMDGFVAKVPKAYPVYDKNYPTNLANIKSYLAKFTNLQPVGRYGMFKYNNMDHSILTGIYAVRNAMGEKYDIWSINTDMMYQESGKLDGNNMAR